MTQTRLITFLGRPAKGSYCPAEHVWRGSVVPCGPTPFVALAIARALELDKGTEVIVLATKEAWEDTGPDHSLVTLGARLQEAFHDAGYLPPDTPQTFLRETHKAKDLWEQFNVLLDALSATSAYEIVLDITHGFRSQPFFAAASVSFVRAVEDRLPALRVVYAAHEARRGGATPIWDMTPFVDLVDWTHMLTLFLRTGRGERAGRAVEELGHQLSREWAAADRQGPPPALKEFGDALTAFSQCLTTVRTGALIGGKRSASTKLAASLAEARVLVEERIPPLAKVLSRLESMTDPLVCDDLGSDQGQRAMASLARLYLNLERYLEAAAVVREALVSRNSVAQDRVPGAALSISRRERAARGLLRTDTSDQDLRNDLMHAGFRPAPRAPSTVREGVEKAVQRLDEVAVTPLPAPAEPGRLFVNLSNHPNQKWPEEQLAAALALGVEVIGERFDAVHDVQLPNVPAGAALDQVQEIARSVLGRLPDDVGAAMVMGEYTLTSLLVDELQWRGVPCFTATTERTVQETALTRVSEFHFVRFREYPGNPPTAVSKRRS